MIGAVLAGLNAQHQGEMIPMRPQPWQEEQDYYKAQQHHAYIPYSHPPAVVPSVYSYGSPYSPYPLSSPLPTPVRYMYPPSLSSPSLFVRSEHPDYQSAAPFAPAYTQEDQDKPATRGQGFSCHAVQTNKKNMTTATHAQKRQSNY